MSDETRRLILARRARFIAATLAGAAVSLAPATARGESGVAAGVDNPHDGGDAGDDERDGSIFVEAGTRDLADADPGPCLSIAKPPDAEPEPCLCVMAPHPADDHGGTAGAALSAAVALVVARRRRARSSG
jgi:MYXO-CTERM domain-containing protein